MRPWRVCILCVAFRLSTVKRPAFGVQWRSEWKRCRHTNSCNRKARKRLYPEPNCKVERKAGVLPRFPQGASPCFRRFSEQRPTTKREMLVRVAIFDPAKPITQQKTCSSTSLKADISPPDPCVLCLYGVGDQISGRH